MRSLLLILLGVSRTNFGQHTPRDIGGYAVLTIPFEEASVTFAVVAEKSELKKKKPIFLFKYLY